MNRSIIYALVLVSFMLLTGCSATGFGVSSSVDGSVVDAAATSDRWGAWAQVATAEAENQQPTFEVIQYRDDGVTPASKVTMDLAPVLGKNCRPMPKGPVAESITAATDGIAKVARTPVATLLGASVLVGQAVGDATTISNESGAVNIGTGSATGATSTTTELVGEAVEVLE